MEVSFKSFLTAILFITFIQMGNGQTFLQLEVWNHTETIKFYEGQRIIIKTVSFPDEWQEKITK